MLPDLSFKRYCTPYEEMEPSLGPGVGSVSCTVTCFDWMVLVRTFTVGAARTATGQRREENTRLLSNRTWNCTADYFDTAIGYLEYAEIGNNYKERKNPLVIFWRIRQYMKSNKTNDYLIAVPFLRWLSLETFRKRPQLAGVDAHTVKAKNHCTGSSLAIALCIPSPFVGRKLAPANMNRKIWDFSTTCYSELQWSSTQRERYRRLKWGIKLKLASKVLRLRICPRQLCFVEIRGRYPTEWEHWLSVLGMVGSARRPGYRPVIWRRVMFSESACYNSVYVLGSQLTTYSPSWTFIAGACVTSVAALAPL